MSRKRYSLKPRDLFVPKASLSGRQASLFAGRRRIVKDAIEAIDMPGTTAVVFGHSGVGKTSFGWQLFEILEGNQDIIQSYPRMDLDPEEYTSFWIESERRYQNIPGLLLALLRPSGAKRGFTLCDRFPTVFDAAATDRIDRAYEINIGIAKAKFAIDPESKERETVLKVLDQAYAMGLEDPFELFGIMLARVKKEAGDREFVIFVDEFDRIPDKTGMGDFVKHCGDARPVIIGVSDTSAELLGDHPSSDRKIMGSEIEVPPLPAKEMREIFQNASRVVAGRGHYYPLVFSSEFKNAVIGAAGGYPAIAQFLGYQSIRLSGALREAERAPVEVGIDSFKAACGIILSGSDVHGKSELNERLREAIGHSWRRASVLDSLAHLTGDWVKLATLRRRLPRQALEGLNRSLEKLEDGGIVRRSATRVMFTTPILRLLIRIAGVANVLYPKKRPRRSKRF